VKERDHRAIGVQKDRLSDAPEEYLAGLGLAFRTDDDVSRLLFRSVSHDRIRRVPDQTDHLHLDGSRTAVEHLQAELPRYRPHLVHIGVFPSLDVQLLGHYHFGLFHDVREVNPVVELLGEFGRLIEDVRCPLGTIDCRDDNHD
jgi:hypothetical protein